MPPGCGLSVTMLSTSKPAFFSVAAAVNTSRCTTLGTATDSGARARSRRTLHRRAGRAARTAPRGRAACASAGSSSGAGARRLDPEPSRYPRGAAASRSLTRLAFAAFRAFLRSLAVGVGFTATARRGAATTGAGTGATRRSGGPHRGRGRGGGRGRHRAARSRSTGDVAVEITVRVPTACAVTGASSMRGPRRATRRGGRRRVDSEQQGPRARARVTTRSSSVARASTRAVARTGDQLGEHDAERVHVGARVGDEPGRLLGREVPGRADDDARFGERFRARRLRDAEVGDLDLARRR